MTSGGGFGSITSVTFTNLIYYSDGSFSTGWSHIVNTINGVLFYNQANGFVVVADISIDGSVSTRPDSSQTIDLGWTSIIADNDEILFYSAGTGDVAVGASPKFSVPTAGQGGIVIRAVSRAYLSRDWTNLVVTVDPTIIR